MSWLTTYSDDNKIVDETVSRVHSFYAYNLGVITHYIRTITETKYRYTSMTEADAAAGVTTLLAATPNGTERTAVAKRQNEGGAYYIEVCDIITTSWAEE